MSRPDSICNASRIPRTLVCITLCISLVLSGCATSPYIYGTPRRAEDLPRLPQTEQQFYQGKPSAILDAADWYWPLSLLGKLLLWDKDVDSHQISSETIAVLDTYLRENELDHVQVLVNTYKPGNQWKRLFANRAVGAGWRYTLGILSVGLYTILPGRFFGGDAYNAYTNTIYLYSDDPSIALHEGGHAKDFSRRKNKGTHAAIYALPLAALYYEAKATNDALGYLQDKQQSEPLAQAYEITYPAYSTYVSGNLLARYDLFSLLGVIPGHIAGQIQASKVRSRAGKDVHSVADRAPDTLE